MPFKLRNLVPFALVLILTLFLQKAIINNPDEIRAWLASFGALTVVVYAVLQFVTIIIAPLGGFALVIAIFALFGPFVGTIIVYAVTTPAYITNFLIAKRYGRSFTKRLVGESGLSFVTRFTEGLDFRSLVLLKLLMNGYFDYISYAAGLSSTTTRQFVIINVIVGIPGFVVIALALFLAPSFAAGIGILYTLPVITGAIYIFLHKRRRRKSEDIADLTTPHEV